LSITNWPTCCGRPSLSCVAFKDLAHLAGNLLDHREVVAKDFDRNVRACAFVVARSWSDHGKPLDPSRLSTFGVSEEPFGSILGPDSRAMAVVPSRRPTAMNNGRNRADL